MGHGATAASPAWSWLQRVSANGTRSSSPIMHVACTDILPIDSSFCATAFTLDCKAQRETAVGAAALSVDDLGRYSKAQVSDMGPGVRRRRDIIIIVPCDHSRSFLPMEEVVRIPFFGRALSSISASLSSRLWWCVSLPSRPCVVIV